MEVPIKIYQFTYKILIHKIPRSCLLFTFQTKTNIIIEIPLFLEILFVFIFI